MCVITYTNNINKYLLHRSLIKSLTCDISTNWMETRELKFIRLSLLDGWSSQRYHPVWEGVGLSVYLINKKYHNNMYIGKDRMKSGTHLICMTFNITIISLEHSCFKVYIIVCIRFEQNFKGSNL